MAVTLVNYVLTKPLIPEISYRNYLL